MASCEQSPDTGNSLGLPSFQTQDKIELYAARKYRLGMMLFVDVKRIDPATFSDTGRTH